jgi:hypothetical protein
MMCLLNFNNFLKSFAIFANYATKSFIILGKFYKSCQKLRFLSNFAIYATKKSFLFLSNFVNYATKSFIIFVKGRKAKVVMGGGRSSFLPETQADDRYL